MECQLKIHPLGISKIRIHFLCWPVTLCIAAHHSARAFLSLHGLLQCAALALSSCLLCCSHSWLLFCFLFRLPKPCCFISSCVDELHILPSFRQPLTQIPVPPVLSNPWPSPQARVSLCLTFPSFLLLQDPVAFRWSCASKTFTRSQMTVAGCWLDFKKWWLNGSSEGTGNLYLDGSSQCDWPLAPTLTLTCCRGTLTIHFHLSQTLASVWTLFTCLQRGLANCHLPRGRRTKIW